MSNKDFWDIFEIIGKVCGIILIPIAISYFGYQYNKALQINEIKSKYIEIAVSILRDNPSIETQGIRSWAIKVFSELSIIEIDEKTLNELKSSALPKDKIATNPDGSIMFNPDGSATIKSSE